MQRVGCWRAVNWQVVILNVSWERWRTRRPWEVKANLAWSLPRDQDTMSHLAEALASAYERLRILTDTLESLQSDMYVTIYRTAAFEMITQRSTSQLDEHLLAGSDIRHLKGVIEQQSDLALRAQSFSKLSVHRLESEQRRLGWATLPTELRLSILEMVVDPYGSYMRVAPLYAVVPLSHVNREWREFVCSAPQLWSVLPITYHSSANMIQHYLQLSQDTHLTLILALEGDQDDTSAHQMTSALAPIIPHIHRWFRLSVYVSHASSLVAMAKSFAGCIAPVLDSFRIECGDGSKLFFWDTFALQCPNLQSAICDEYYLIATICETFISRRTVTTHSQPEITCACFQI